MAGTVRFEYCVVCAAYLCTVLYCTVLYQEHMKVASKAIAAPFVIVLPSSDLYGMCYVDCKVASTLRSNKVGECLFWAWFST